MKKKAIFVLCLLLAVFAGGCMEETEELVLNETVNVSEYEFGLFLDPDSHELPANVTTYYLLEKERQIRVVTQLINSSEIQIIPMESLGGGPADKPIENLALLVGPANRTTVSVETFGELSNLSEVSDVNYTLLKETKQNQKFIRLVFDEPVTGYLAYTMKLHNSQNFITPNPPSRFVRVVLPETYATGNRLFGIPKPAPSSLSHDSEGRQVVFWRDLKKEELLQVKYYKQSAMKLFLAAFIALFFGMLLVLSSYSRNKKELIKSREIFELEKEYLEAQKKKKK